MADPSTTSTSTVLTTITSSALSSTATSESRGNAHTSAEIIAISIAIFLFMLFIPGVVMALRRQYRPKYEHPEHGTKSMDAIQFSQEYLVSEPSKDNFRSILKRAEVLDPLTITETEQTLPTCQSQFPKVTYHDTLPSPPVKDCYEDLPAHEDHITSLNSTAQYPNDNIGSKTATLRSSSPSSSKLTIKLPPLIIPGKTLNNSNGERSGLSKKTVSRKSSRPLDSSCETEDSFSLYSMASASSYFPKPSQETIKHPPMPPLPNRFASPTQSTSSNGTDVIAIANMRDEENLITILPPSLSLSPPSFKFNGDNGEEAEDVTQIHNVAKLLYSRQARLPKEAAASRHFSLTSHIERSGSIRPVITHKDEEPIDEEPIDHDIIL